MGGKEDDVRIFNGEETSSERENMDENEEDDVTTPLHDLQVHPSTKGTSSSSSSFTSDKLRGADRVLLERVQKAGNAEKKEPENVEGSQTKIQKLPDSVLKKEILKEYEIKPTVIAIGDFYSRHDMLKNENLKHKLAARFIQNSGKKGEIILTEFKEKFTVDELKMVYRGNVHTKNQEKLTRTYFLDGCTVLQFIDSYVNNGIEDSDEISNGEADNICHDLFLLENQIPFKVLVILMRLSDRGVELARDVYRFISMNIMAPAIYYEGRLDKNISRLPAHPKDLFQEDNKVAVPVHLLDLLRSELLFDDDYSKKSSESAPAPKISSHLPQKKVEEENYRKRPFYNIQDLKEVDIKFKADYSRGLRSVSFSNRLLFSPKLKLPPLIVDKSTKKKLLNLVAYEMCTPDNSKQDNTVTSYLRLLDSLIDCEQDVKDLRSAHILRNHLSSDEEVANLFNSVGSYLVLRDVYVAEKKKIQKHYKRKMASWTAQFRREHFRNPTTFFAFLVGLVILAATCIQAIYTVHPKKD